MIRAINTRKINILSQLQWQALKVIKYNVTFESDTLNYSACMVLIYLVNKQNFFFFLGRHWIGAEVGEMQEMWFRSLDQKIPWRRKWQPPPVFLPGKSHGQRSLMGYSPWDCKELDTTERLNHHSKNKNIFIQQIFIKKQTYQALFSALRNLVLCSLLLVGEGMQISKEKKHKIIAK